MMWKRALLFLVAGCAACLGSGDTPSRDGGAPALRDSQNAVDSVVQPEEDMRHRMRRSQEDPSEIDETESEGKGDVTNDNSASNRSGGGALFPTDQ